MGDRFVTKARQRANHSSEGRAGSWIRRSFRNVPAAVSHYRALLLSAAAALYPLIFATFLLVEKPGLGLGHFYYIPIALVALANGPAWGAGAGIASTASTRSGS